MPRYAQLVMGPAGSGKSTYCNTIVTHCQAMRRTVHVVNLDPAAEEFKYPMLADIRELISVEDVMDDKELHFGPNGGLIFCMEYFAENFDWLKEQLDEIEDDYIIFDCPGQIELYTHVPVMRQLVEQLKAWNFYICGVFLIDAQFIIEPSKFVSGVLSALSAMVNLEVAHVNVISKLDLLNKKALKKLNRYLEPDLENLLVEETENNFKTEKFKSLNRAIARLIDDYSLVQFLPLDNTKEETISRVLDMIDQSIQYGEDFEPKEPKDEINDEEDETGKDIENYLDS